MTRIFQQYGGTAARIRQRHLVKRCLGWIALMPLFVGAAAWGEPPTAPVTLPQRESAWPQAALPGAHGSSSKPTALPSEQAAFATLGRALDAQLEAISVALGHLVAPPSHSGSLTAGSGFGEYAEGVRSIVLPRLRALAIEAGALARRAALAAEPTAQGALQKAAGARYQAAMLIAQVVRLEVDCAIVGSYADAAGVPFGAVKARLERFDAEMSPMIDAVASLDGERMRWAAEALRPKSEEVTAELSQAMQAIGKNEELSRKVIGTANVLLLSLALYHVGRLPVVDGTGGGAAGMSSPRGLPVAGVVGGAAVAGRLGIDAQAVVETVAAVKKLVDVGALDPVLIGGLIGIGGARGTVPQLEKPLLMAQTGAGGSGNGTAGFETIRGGGTTRQGGIVYVGKGAAIRQGPGGLIERLRLTFRRVPRQDQGISVARRQFLRELAQDPRVRSFFGEGSPALARLRAGELPGEDWEVHHNLPATIEAPGIKVNDPRNFSLLPEWLHLQVTQEWTKFLDGVGSGQTATFEFPVFDRFVPSH